MPRDTSQAPVGVLINFFESKTADAATEESTVQQIIELYTQREAIIGTRRKLQTDSDGGQATTAPRKRRKLNDTQRELDPPELNSHELKRRDSAHSPPPNSITWLSFACQQPEAQHTDLVTLRKLVSSASTVGNSNALSHLQHTLSHWRERASASTPTALYRPDTSSRLSTSAERFRYHYRRMDHASTQAISTSITRRYCAARMRAAFNEHMALCAHMTPTKQENTVLSDLFSLVFPRAAGGSSQAQKWHTFRRTLKAGKRWLALEEMFSCGVFALLPIADVPCFYVERGLTEDLFAVWCRVLQQCCPMVGRMAEMVAPVVRRLAEDLPPLEEKMRLEIEGAVLGRRVADGELVRLLEVATEGKSASMDDESAWFI